LTVTGAAELNRTEQVFKDIANRQKEDATAETNKASKDAKQAQALAKGKLNAEKSEATEIQRNAAIERDQLIQDETAEHERAIGVEQDEFANEEQVQATGRKQLAQAEEDARNQVLEASAEERMIKEETDAVATARKAESQKKLAVLKEQKASKKQEAVLAAQDAKAATEQLAHAHQSADQVISEAKAAAAEQQQTASEPVAPAEAAVAAQKVEVREGPAHDEARVAQAVQDLKDTKERKATAAAQLLLVQGELKAQQAVTKQLEQVAKNLQGPAAEAKLSLQQLEAEHDTIASKVRDETQTAQAKQKEADTVNRRATEAQVHSSVRGISNRNSNMGILLISLNCAASVCICLHLCYGGSIS
jgi:hypothetical protein